ncbi:MAG: hypothetical protein LUC93_05670 [Planctomycetaceae bacterium]|nr:hypothetical protein [Planctomycetaceae bacterium]
MGAIGGMGLSLISTGIGAFGAYQNAAASNRAASYNASVNERNAQYAEARAGQAATRGAFDLSLLRVDNKRALSSLAQGFVNSGVEASSGSALNLLAEQHGMNIRGEQVQQYNTDMEVYGHRMEAENYRAAAAMARSSRTNPWLAGFTSLLGGFSQTYNQYSQYRMLTGASYSGSRNSCYL